MQLFYTRCIYPLKVYALNSDQYSTVLKNGHLLKGSNYCGQCSHYLWYKDTTYIYITAKCIEINDSLSVTKE